MLFSFLKIILKLKIVKKRIDKMTPKKPLREPTYGRMIILARRGMMRKNLLLLLYANKTERSKGINKTKNTPNALGSEKRALILWILIQ